MHRITVCKLTLALFALMGAFVSTSVAGKVQSDNVSPANHLLALRAEEKLSEPPTPDLKSTCEFYKVTMRDAKLNLHHLSRVTLRLDIDVDNWRAPLNCGRTLRRKLKYFAIISGHVAHTLRYGARERTCVIKIETEDEGWILSALRCIAASGKAAARPPAECVSRLLFVVLVIEYRY